jgi:hypothetical protein
LWRRQALLHLAEHTIAVAARDGETEAEAEAAEDSRHTLSKLLGGNSGISEADARRFAEILAIQL